MAHARQQIIEDVVDILNATPTTWKTALAGRVEPLRIIWPYLLVFADSEKEEAMTVHSPSPITRDMSLNVVGKIKLPGNADTSSIEDSMNALCSEVETKLTSAALRATLPNTRLSLEATDMNVMVTEEDKIDHAEIIMSFSVKYQTLEGSPDTLI